MPSLEIRQERDAASGVEVIAPQGEIDVSNVEVLDQVLAEALEQQPRGLLVDLSGVEYLDSAGVSSLLRAGQVSARAGGQLHLAGGNRFIRRLLQMTGVDRLFPLHHSVAEALGAPAGGSGRGAAPASAESGTPADAGGVPRPLLRLES